MRVQRNHTHVHLTSTDDGTCSMIVQRDWASSGVEVPALPLACVMATHCHGTAICQPPSTGSIADNTASKPLCCPQFEIESINLSIHQGQSFCSQESQGGQEQFWGFVQY